MRSLNCVTASALLSALIPLHGFTSANAFVLFDTGDATVDAIVGSFDIPRIAITPDGHQISGPLCPGQLFVLSQVAQLTQTLKIIHPEDHAECQVDINIHDEDACEYADGGEAVLAAAAHSDYYEAKSAGHAVLDDDYVCMTIAELRTVLAGGMVDFTADSDGFYTSAGIIAEREHDAPTTDGLPDGTAILGDVFGDGMVYLDPSEAERVFGSAWCEANLIHAPEAGEPELPTFEQMYPGESGYAPLDTLLEREEVLFDAADVITGQREGEYGSPEESFTGIAAMWSAYLGVELSPEQAAWMMVLFKIIRAEHSYKRDNYVDAAGYVGIAGELALDDATSPEVSRSVH